MLSQLYHFFYPAPSSHALKEDKKKEILPRADFIIGDRVKKKSPQYQLISAAAEGQLMEMKKLLARYPKEIDIKKSKEDQREEQFDALSAATLNGHEQVVTFLLDRRQRERDAPITGHTFECAVLSNQINILRALVNASDAEELFELNRRMKGYIVLKGSTDLAVLLRQPSADLIVKSLALGLMDKESQKYRQYGESYAQKMKKMGPVDPLCEKLFSSRVESVYHVKLQADCSLSATGLKDSIRI